jgi:hypothetical protein
MRPGFAGLTFGVGSAGSLASAGSVAHVSVSSEVGNLLCLRYTRDRVVIVCVCAFRRASFPPWAVDG